jgi:hypothetical protein
VNDGRGNINNIIDTTDYLDKVVESKIQAKTNSKESTKAHDGYNCEVPLKKDLHVEANFCPDNYRELYSMIPRGVTTSYSNENTSLFAACVPAHVNLNHLSLRNDDGPINSHVLVTTTTSRLRNKFVTLIYYKPVN